MKCIYCGYKDSKVIESRCSEDRSKIRRRRECEMCSRRFTTYEVVENIPIVVIKRDGSREKFERKKVLDGLLKACEKRAISLSDVEKMVDEIEIQVQNSLDKEVSSSLIGELSMEALKSRDEVAYIRFASVYRKFKDVQAFLDELKKFFN